jgi:hypothetical protein
VICKELAPEEQKRARDERNRALLAALSESAAAMRADLHACVALTAEPEAEMATMVLEQLQPVLDAGDIDSAPDFSPFVKDARVQLDSAMARVGCGSSRGPAR